MTEKCLELKTVTLDVCDHPKLVIEKRDAEKVLQRVSQLRYITVNGVSWKVCIFWYDCMYRTDSFFWQRDWVVPKSEQCATPREFVATLVTDVARDTPFEYV